MSSLSKTGLRRALLSLCAITALSAMLAAPALADPGYRGRGHYNGGPRYYGGGHDEGHRYYGGGHWHPPFPPFPFPRLLLGLPPVVIVAGRHEDYDRGYDGGGRAYDRGYEDGYGDRSREEWRRREHYRHSHHEDCDHDYY